MESETRPASAPTQGSADERTRFLRKLAHDLRGPLNTISLTAQALSRQQVLPPAQAKSLSVITSNADRIARTIRDLLEPPEPVALAEEPAEAAEAATSARYRVLLVEDNPDDARTLYQVLADTGAVEFQLVQAGSMAEATRQVQTSDFDLMLLDLFLPDSQGLETVSWAQAFAPQVATVVLTGVSDRETAIAAVRQGAQDYLVKGLTDGPGLVRAMYYAMERKTALRERERLIQELQEALATVKKLSGLLPICASCKRIRDDQGSWNQLEEYIHDHSEAVFSHGICPECAKKLFPDAFD